MGLSGDRHLYAGGQALIGGKSNSGIQPIALGATLQNSTYGQTIPVLYGRTKQAMYQIWSENLRQGSSAKKAKKILSLGKKGQPTYIENVDFLLSTNPIVSPLQFWINQNQLLPLTFVEFSCTPGAAGLCSGSVSTLTVPDARLYQILGVTVSGTYSKTFDDYGSQGPDTISGSWETPLWNMAYAGPDVTNMSAYRWWPFVYYWQPGSGAVIGIPSCLAGSLRGYQFNVYYAELYPSGSNLYSKSQSNTAVPAGALRFTFEPQLGNGPEYTANNDYSAQQIIYPHYAGLGSPDYDLGTTQTLPACQPEVLGTFPLYATGDADFADMVEDIFKGAGQAGFGGTQAYTEVQHGIGCFNFPGCVQKVVAYDTPTLYPPAVADPTMAAYPLPNTAGNFLIVFAACTGVSPTIMDDATNAWTAVFGSSPNGHQIWYATAKSYQAGNTVTVSGSCAALVLLEVGGVDTLDQVNGVYPGMFFANDNFGLTNQITTTGAKGTPMYLLSLTLCWEQLGGLPTNVLAAPANQNPALIPNFHWNGAIQIPPTGTYNTAALMDVEERTVYTPGTYGFALKTGVGLPGGFSPSTEGYIMNAMFSFKCSEPPSYPMPLGNIIDNATLQQVRNQCRANGMYGSLLMDSQQNASDYLGNLYKAMNAAAVWAGFNLQSIPYSEVSTAGNGAVYVAPTAAGPVANLTEDDMIASGDTPPVEVSRKAQVDVPNLLQIQHPNRAGDYNDVIVSQPEAGSIALYGPRKDSPQQMRMIQDPAIARLILGIEIRRQNYLRNTYKFKLKAKWKLLLPMDLVTIPTSATMSLTNFAQAGIPAIPVRLTSIAEDDQYNLDCEAEPFIYGCSAPLPLSATAVAPYQSETGASPGAVNTPVIFEPVARLCAAPPAQLWLVVSGANPVYGGCVVYLSTDGGSSYNPVGTIVGNAITGVTVGDWPAAADPDTANNLAVDLTESLGALVSYGTSDRDNFVYPCYVAGGGSSPITYELMAYNSATMTAANKYTLAATGSGNELRRAVYGAPVVSDGCDHPNGSRFAFLGPQGPGILKLDMDPTWIGKELYFKFAAFNNLQGALDPSTGLTAYTYTPTGIAQPANPAATNYSQSPADALTNPTATTIHMSLVSVSFPQITVNYNARTFTISNPSSPTTYYVTIADPNYLGDTGSADTLTATCQTSSALCGVVGNTYIGSIVAIAGGSGTIVTPGGWPPPQLFLVNGT